MRIRQQLVSIAGTVLACATPSIAGVGVMTFAGTADFVDFNGVDAECFFGCGNFSDAPFVAQFTYDFGNPGATRSLDAGVDTLIGGLTLATLTINHRTLSFPIGQNNDLGAGNGQLDASLDESTWTHNCSPDSDPYTCVDWRYERYLEFASTLTDGSPTLESVIDLRPATISGSFSYSDFCYGNCTGTYPTLGTFSGGFVALSYVPEPANWALMIVGFGMTGFALRCRRVATA